MLAVAAQPDGGAFVARCLVGESAAESLAPCERDIHVGDNLSLSYRFPTELLGDWREARRGDPRQGGVDAQNRQLMRAWGT